MTFHFLVGFGCVSDGLQIDYFNEWFNSLLNFQRYVAIRSQKLQ